MATHHHKHVTMATKTGRSIAHFLAELRSLDLHKSSLDSLHEAPLVAKGNAAGADGVLVAISVNSSIDHTPKQIVHDVSQDVWGQGEKRGAGSVTEQVTLVHGLVGRRGLM